MAESEDDWLIWREPTAECAYSPTCGESSAALSQSESTASPRSDDIYRIAEAGAPDSPPLSNSVSRAPDLSEIAPNPSGSCTPIKKQSGVLGVTWNQRQSSWLAQFRDGSKNIQKFFAVSKYGEVEALRLAIEFRQKNEKPGKASLRIQADSRSGHAGIHSHNARNCWIANGKSRGLNGVSWDEQGNSWKARWKDGGKSCSTPLVMPGRPTFVSEVRPI